MNFEAAVPVLRTHLQAVMREGDFDVAADAGSGTLDIATDHWTVHLEEGGGFLAIDDEPEEPARYAAARRAVMSEKVEHALALADRELGGAISSILSASGDPFTLDFVVALASRSGGDGERLASSSHERA